MEPLVPDQTSQVRVSSFTQSAGERSSEVMHFDIVLVEVYETFEALTTLSAWTRLVPQIMRFKSRRVWERPVAFHTVQ